MPGWTILEGLAVALPLANVDTDQLIPARFMSIPRSAGYGAHLLHDLRRGGGDALRADFPLNRHPGANILVARRNFGCGSSREAAVYALVDAGFRAVIAPGFGDIFAGNAVNNALLPANVTEDDAETLIAALAQNALPCAIDLARGEIALGPHRIRFDLNESWRLRLQNGWDEIDLTRADADGIEAFRTARRNRAPWVWPGTSG